MSRISYNYHWFNVIIKSLSQSDHIKRLRLYYLVLGDDITQKRDYFHFIKNKINKLGIKVQHKRRLWYHFILNEKKDVQANHRCTQRGPGGGAAGVRGNKSVPSIQNFLQNLFIKMQ